MLFGLYKQKISKKLLKKSLKKGIINLESAKWHSFLNTLYLPKKETTKYFYPSFMGRLWYPLFTISPAAWRKKAVPVNSRTLTD